MSNRRSFLKATGLLSAGFVTVSPLLNTATLRQYNPENVQEVRKACYQFAMQYFHFCKSLVDVLGEDAALPVVQKTIFELGIERSNKMRARVLELKLEPVLENFRKVSDLPRSGWDNWDSSLGGVKCPYAEVWLGYFNKHPWFKRFASLYCDVIDTTNIENFTRSTSHRITKNLLWGDEECTREYFESEEVKHGKFTYGVID